MYQLVLASALFAAKLAAAAPPAEVPTDTTGLIEALESASKAEADADRARAGFFAPADRRNADAPAGGASSAVAVGKPTNAAGGEIGSAAGLGATALALALLLFAAAAFVKRYRRSPARAEAVGAGLQLIESLWIGRGQRILLVNAAGHRILLGASAGGIRSLAVLGDVADAIAVERSRVRALPSGTSKKPLDLEAKPDDDSAESFAGLVRGALDSESKPKRRVEEVLERLNRYVGGSKSVA